MTRVRDFNPTALDTHASPGLHVSWKTGWFFETRVWQFIIFLPRWLVSAEARERICTDEDQKNLEELLQRDFGGYTSSTTGILGVGHRGAAFEKNIHRQIAVLAARWRGTKRYFKALRKELEACSGEEQILILRQDLVIA
jgi:hypothetical protein